MENTVLNPWDRVVRARLTPRQAIETLFDHRQRLEDDVEHLRRALVLAMELRNSSAPILTLPDETILQIFLALRDLFYPLPRRDVEKPRYFAWLVVVAVCRRLRRVALASPGLHTCTSTRILPEQLVRRSLDLSYPLDIDFDVGAPRDKSATMSLLFLFSEYGRRVQSCSMQVDPHTADSSRHPHKWLQCTPNLESLVISSATGIWYAGMPMVNFENTPKLTRLEINCVRLHFTSVIFLELTELTLSNICLDEVQLFQETHFHFHCLFGRMRRLRRLALIDVWFESHPGIVLNLNLPDSLRHLEYRSPTSLRALSYLAPSTSVRVKVVQNGTPSDTRIDMGRLPIVLDAWLGNDNLATRVKLIVRDNTVASEARVAYYRGPSGAEPDFELMRYIDEDFRISELLPGSMYNTVTHMEFDVDWDYPLFHMSPGSMSSLGNLPELSTLSFTGPRASMVSPIPHLSDWPGGSMTPILWRPDQLFTQDRDTMGDIRVLLDWLTTRKCNGLSLRTLYLPVRLSAALDETAVAAGSGTVDWRDVADEVFIGSGRCP